MAPGDLAPVKTLSDRVHPGLVERIEVFADRLAAYPDGSRVLADGRAILGYAVSHPATLYAPPPLDHLLKTISPGADSYYIHDVVVAPELRGAGHAQRGVEGVLETASAYSVTALISVYGTMPFWERFGFRDATDAMATEKLALYGAGARYMVRPNPPSTRPGLHTRNADAVQKD